MSCASFEELLRNPVPALEHRTIFEPLPNLGPADFSRRRVFHEIV